VGFNGDKYLHTKEDTIMDAANELSITGRLESARAILRQFLDEIAAEVGIALCDAGLSYPVYMSVPNSGDALGMIITSADPPDDDWEKVVAIFSKIIGGRLGSGGLRTRELTCAAAANSAMNGADVITD
jgi:hypothetical protein